MVDDIIKVTEIIVYFKYLQAITTLAFPCTRLFYYYNVVLFRKFLTMIANSIRYIEKFLTKRLVLRGSGTLNLISF
jgi:hypothetical protein